MTDRDRVYAMGRTQGERARLSQQGRVFAPHSEYLLRQASCLETAERIVAEVGFSNVHFQQRTLPDIDLHAPVDALAGRLILILIHLGDPASMLTELNRYVRPAGIVTWAHVPSTTG